MLIKKKDDNNTGFQLYMYKLLKEGEETALALRKIVVF